MLDIDEPSCHNYEMGLAHSPTLIAARFVWGDCPSHFAARSVTGFLFPISKETTMSCEMHACVLLTSEGQGDLIQS